MPKKKNPEDRYRIILGRFQDSIEDSKLKLALLKEKASYRMFFEESAPKVLEKLQTLAERNKQYLNMGRHGPPSPEDDPEYWKIVEDASEVIAPFLGGCMRFGMNNPFSTIFRPEDVLTLLDPSKEIPDKLQRHYIARLFFSATIRGVSLPGQENEHPARIPFARLTRQPSAPFERLLLVDLRKKRRQLETEFRSFLDMVEVKRGMTPEAYKSWAPDTRRARREAWRHLEVWKRRRQRKGFPEIARALQMKKDTAKKSFYRAYELIEGRPYLPEDFRLAYWEIRKAELKRTCATCPDHPKNGGSCDTLCPDALLFVDQDTRRAVRPGK